MRTVYLGAEEVRGYLHDLLQRLKKPEVDLPTAWFPIGDSGESLVEVMRDLPIASQLLSTVTVHRVDFDRDTRAHTFEGGKEAATQDASGSSVLVLDGSVHSGSTMKAVARAVQELGPRQVTSYTLVLKRGTSFVPNYFGVVIDDHDRAYFLLDPIPNNRMMHSGVVRLLEDGDMGRPYVVTDDEGYDKWTWSDHWYEMQADPQRRVYVYELGGVLKAAISFRLLEREEVFIDQVVVDKSAQGQGIGGHLVRWANTQGRCACCGRTRLWADARALEFYVKNGFKRPAVDAMTLDGVEFHAMEMVLASSPASDRSWP